MGATPKSPITVFCGKGGVGKTTLSLAFGLWHANAGRKVVVVSSHPLAELAVTVSLAGLREISPAAAANLFVVHIDAREILGNKVRQQIPSEFLARAVLSSRLYQNLVEVAPGIKEIAFLARLRQLAERQSLEDGMEGYDLLVWDTPATGHFLQTLRAARNFDTYLSGPFALLGKELAQFVSDPGSFRLVPVTVLEEMPVQEAIEMCGELEGRLKIQPAAVLCNLSSPLLNAPESLFEDLARRAAAEDPGSEGLGLVLDRLSAERELHGKLQRAVKLPLRAVSRVTRWNSDLDLLLTIGSMVGPAVSGDAP